ncbi:MAG TPA: hypothetical protein VFX70_07900 [Mycobacteriales bacterium]|nr:hypothetical protein [Mycobacteriales bacterium]
MRVVLSGVFGLVGGGLLAAGPYLAFGGRDGAARQIDLDTFPAPLLLVGLAGLVAVAGLGAILFARRPFGSGLVGLLIAPAATVVAFQAPRVLDLLLSAQGRQSLRIGGWLVTAGAAVTAVAALLAAVVAVSRMAGRGGVFLPVVGAVAAAGLLQWWLVAPTGTGHRAGVRYLVVDQGGSVWPGVVALAALALVIAAVSIASARCGAASVGIALGGALAVGGELAARYTVRDAVLRKVAGGVLRNIPVVLTGVTVVALLTLAVGLAVATSHRSAEEAEALALREAQARSDQGAAGWEQPNPEDPWPSTDQSGATGVWGGNPEATGSGRSWSAVSEASSTSTRWPRS